MSAFAPGAQHERPIVYDRLTVRERIVREIVRRIEEAPFATSGIRPKVIRREVPDAYDRASGAIIAVLEGREVYEVNATGAQPKLTLFLQMAIPVGEGEEAATLLGLVSAERAETLQTDKKLKEGGTGPALVASIVPVEMVPDADDDDGGDVAAGNYEWTLTYRTKPTGPFDL